MACLSLNRTPLPYHVHTTSENFLKKIKILTIQGSRGESNKKYFGEKFLEK